MKRIYELVIKDHLKKYNQMVFLSGPRQVGKTTLADALKKSYKNYFYLNWDVFSDRASILAGQIHLGELLELNVLKRGNTIIVFDEIHKYSKWKSFLKGFYDLYKAKCKIVVTGSAKLDIYKKGGDSMMGRYFNYSIFPLTLGELNSRKVISRSPLVKPKKIPNRTFNSLVSFGGFPEPFLNAEKRFSMRWKSLRDKQLFKEDISSLTHIYEVEQLEVLSGLLQYQVCQIVNRTELSNKINVPVSTVSRWLKILKNFYFCFEIKPWSRNVRRSLTKEPKIYLYDWSSLEDDGARAENLVAVHLYKFVNFYTELGFGNYSLHYLRNKEKEEVDFVVVKDNKPWFLVEVKLSSNNSISKHLYSFQEALKVPHAFQVVFDLEYVNEDCFKRTHPTIVPAKTFLSQLI